jgi:hypothetical protein
MTALEQQLEIPHDDGPGNIHNVLKLPPLHALTLSLSLYAHDIYVLGQHLTELFQKTHVSCEGLACISRHTQRAETNDRVSCYIQSSGVPRADY